jgi:hypothetical protein
MDWGGTDVQNIPINVKYSIHENARFRAQSEVERLIRKKLKHPFHIGFTSNKDDSKLNESSILTIETFWCYPNMPLHSAYFMFYTSENYYFNFK